MDNNIDVLKSKQRMNIPENKKLKDSDFKRILKKIDSPLFGDNCCLWKGYITDNKSKYINFYFNKTKIALHRLLYLNFIGNLHDNVYLGYKCNNNGICCNINHLVIKKNNKKKKKIKKKNTVEFDF